MNIPGILWKRLSISFAAIAEDGMGCGKEKLVVDGRFGFKYSRCHKTRKP